MNKAGGNDSKNTLHCTFCGKSQHEVRKLIAGPTVFICDQCVAPSFVAGKADTPPDPPSGFTQTYPPSKLL